MPISLSDDELEIVMSAAAPLPPQDRSRFLIDVAAELEKHRSDLGPGLITRVVRELQRKHFAPPTFTNHRGASKYDR
jgi:hypothetical protein